MPSPRTHTYCLRPTEQRQAHKQRIAQRVATRLRIEEIKRLEREKQECIERISKQMRIAEQLRIEQERVDIKKVKKPTQHLSWQQLKEQRKDLLFASGPTTKHSY